MTKPTTSKFGEFVIAIGNGADPEVFSAPCGLTSKGFNFTASTTDDTVPDCDDPDAPAWSESSVTSLSRDISGSGITAQENLQLYDDWAVSGLPKNVRISQPLLGQTITWTGPFILTTLNLTADLGTKIKMSMALKSAGEVTRTVA